jgi:hypothetical protein
MHKLILISFITFGFIFTEGIFREEIHKLVAERGTINFSDNPTSPVNGAAKGDGGEIILKRNEMANLPGQGIYKSVDEKGTINFSDNPTSSVIRTKEGAAKQDGAEVLKRNEEALKRNEEVLKRNEMANRRPMTDDEIKAVLLTRPTWRGSASSPGWGSSGSVGKGRS